MYGVRSIILRQAADVTGNLRKRDPRGLACLAQARKVCHQIR